MLIVLCMIFLIIFIVGLIFLFKQENNNKVKELKEKKLECKLSKWWLYFGKVD